MIEDRIKKVVAEVIGVQPEEINNSSSPGSVGDWDSLNHIKVILAIEDEFNIKFSQSELESMVNFKIIKAFVLSHLDEN